MDPRTEEQEAPKPPRWRIFTNKYVVAILVFAVWMLFFDSNNMFSQMKKRGELRKLRSTKAYYEKEIEANEKLTKDLRYKKSKLEEFGREEYLMKRDNEDIFLVIGLHSIIF